MKNSSIYSLFAGAVASLLLAACTTDPLANDTISGNRVPLSDLNLYWSVDKGGVYVTKAAQSVQTENTVRSLYVLLADNSGKIVHRKSYWVAEENTDYTGYDGLITDYTEKTSESDDQSTGTIPGFFDGFSDTGALGVGMSIYSVANFHYSTGLAAKLADETMTTVEALKALTDTNLSGVIDRTGFVMVGIVDNIDLTVNSDGTVVDPWATIELERIDARINFNVSVNINGASGLTFTNMTYRVHEIPNTSYLFGKEKGSTENWDASVNSDDFSCMSNSYSFDDATDDTSGTFSFYLKENRPNPKQLITTADKGDYASLYAMREAWTGDYAASVDDRTFTYAPDHGTLVEISGYLSYSRTADGETEQVGGNVTYIVHLGETGSTEDLNDVDKVNNYDVRRNVNYTYTVTITGINSIEVEVNTDEQTGKETRPGYEGNITVSTGNIYEIDAHYGRIRFTLDKISLQNGNGWNITTPYGTINFDPNEPAIESPYDYKWALFAVNSEFGFESGEMVKFPGVQAYDGGLSFNGGTTPSTDEILADTGNKIQYGGSTMTFKQYLQSGYDDDNYYYTDNSRLGKLTDNACLRDIHQLLRHLNSEANNLSSSIFTGETGQEQVTITAFVNEYTYVYDPRTQDYAYPGTSLSEAFPEDAEERLLLWKDYADASNRVLNITPVSSTNYSTDGNSSVTNSIISITQNSIKTIYNKDNETLTTAWGLETINETGRLDADNNNITVGTRGNTTGDGRTNFLNFWVPGDDDSGSGSGSIKWTDVMTSGYESDDENALTDGYRNALYACITRNRDLNGNDIIDADEIYWYLAARDELAGLWVGEDALDESVHLYTGDGTWIDHYVSSSRREETAWWILWAEEGSSLGALRADGDNPSDGWNYRCVRNLGIDVATEAAPTHFAQLDETGYDAIASRYISVSGSDNYWTVDLSFLKTQALRSSDDGGTSLPFDTERDASNRPYVKFDVLMADINDTNISWASMKSNIDNGNNPCPSGWRVPNQREFNIMLSLEDISRTFSTVSNYNLAVATSYSFNGLSPLYPVGDRNGFHYNPPNLALLTNANSTYVHFRCVRDHTTD